MKTPSANESCRLVEEFLIERKNSNEEKNIWPSENIVIDRLLQQSSEMKCVYEELFVALPRGFRHHDMCVDRWTLVIDAILGEAAVNSPEKIRVVREACNHATELTKDIQKAAHHLADLMRRRQTLMHRHGLRREIRDWDPVAVLDLAAIVAGRDNYQMPYRFKDNVFPSLEQLSYRFDSKYWPDTTDFVEAIGDAQDQQIIEAGDSATREALESRKASVRDFMRSLDDCLDGLDHYGAKVQFSLAAYATIVNIALGLDADVTPEDVKTYRATQRKKRNG